MMMMMMMMMMITFLWSNSLDRGEVEKMKRNIFITLTFFVIVQKENKERMTAVVQDLEKTVGKIKLGM